MTGPTLNASYNVVLAKRAEEGFDATPECEGCGEDLTGKSVFRMGPEWLCGECREKEHRLDRGPSDEWLRAEERRQMGIV